MTVVGPPELSAPPQAGSSSQAPAPSPAKSKLLWSVLRWVVSVAAIAYVASIIDWREALEALGKLTWIAFAAAASFTLLGLFLGALRWRALLSAFGATRLPPVRTLFRLYVVSLFYNTFLPGAVGGDVVRGVALRESFGEKGATASIAVVFVERVLGLGGLFMVAAIMGLSGQVQGSEAFVPFAALAMLASLGAFAFIAVGHRFAPRLPGPLAKLAARLPALSRAAPLVPAAVISVLTHITSALAGHSLILAMAPDTHLAESLAVVPLASAAAFFPFTVSGLGARETAFVYLYAAVGVPKSVALVTSLGLWLSQTAVAALGGVLAVAHPVTRASE